MNKRGQEGITLGTLLLIILGVVVVIVIILGATGIFGDIFSKREALPGDLEAVAQSCKIASQAGLFTDYCYNFKKVSKNEYINCQDARVEESLDRQSAELIPCTNSILLEKAKAEVCRGIPENKKEDTFFNGIREDTCGSWIVTCVPKTGSDLSGNKEGIVRANSETDAIDTYKKDTLKTHADKYGCTAELKKK